jgi:hypothetical protein
MIGTAILGFSLALIAVLVAHPTKNEAIQALLGSTGLGIVLGGLSFPVFYIFFKRLLLKNHK